MYEKIGILDHTNRIMYKNDLYKQNISYEFFLQIVDNEILYFTKEGFPYYEGGVYGFGWCWYYFSDERDREEYLQYLKDHPNLLLV